MAKRIICLFLYFICFYSFTSKLEVRMIASVMRHGARSPYYYDDNHTNKDSLGFFWTIDPAELTQVGRRQHYILGLKQREEFDSFIGDYYSTSEITAYTSNKGRTKESIQAYFQGLFPKSEHLSNEQIERAFPPVVVSDSINKIAHSTSSPIRGEAVSATFNQLNPKIDKYYFMASICKNFPDYTKESNVEIDQNILRFSLKWKSILEQGFGVIVDFRNPGKSRIKLWNVADTFIANYLNGNDLSSRVPLAKQAQFFTDIQIFFSDDMFKGTYCDQNNGYYLARASKTKLFQDVFEKLDERIKLNNKEYSSLNPKMLAYFVHDYDLTEIMLLFNKIFNLDFNTPIVPSSFTNFVLSFNTESKEYHIDIKLNDKDYISMNYSAFKKSIEKLYLPLSEINEFCGY